MIEIEAKYDREEQGWATKPVLLDGDISLEVELTTEGYVVVKQLEEDTDIYRHVFVSSYCKKAKCKINGWSEFKTIRIFTSVEPKSIRYTKIECIN